MKKIEYKGKCYLVDPDGGVFNLKGRPYKLSNHMKGYLRVGNMFVHRLVALAYIPNPDPETLTQVNHKDSDKRNNKVSNLEWVSPFQNVRHAIESGNQKLGLELPHSKLSDSDVKKIRELVASGKTQRDISVEFKVNQSTISRIFNDLRRYNVS